MSVSLIFSCSLQTAVIHSGAAERKHESFSFFFSSLPLLPFSSSAEAFSCLLSISIAHLSSFVSPPLVPIQSVSIPPNTLSRFPLQLLSFQPHLSIFPTSIRSSSTNSVVLPPPVCHLCRFPYSLPFRKPSFIGGFCARLPPFLAPFRANFADQLGP